MIFTPFIVDSQPIFMKLQALFSSHGVTKNKISFQKMYCFQNSLFKAASWDDINFRFLFCNEV